MREPTNLELEIARRTLPDVFAEYASRGAFKPFVYQRFIARKIARAIARGGGRLIVNLPSRHGKSELCSHWLPTWFVDNRPDKRIILSSYGAELAQHWGRIVRNEFDRNDLLITHLRDDSKAANRWNTPEGGGMLAVGVGGPVVGFGGDLIVIDDPHKDWKEAHSRVFRNRVIEWFGSTLYSRQEPNATIVLLMQRMHPEDLSGYLISEHSDPWEIVKLPAMAEANDAMSRQLGDPLCPERYDRAALDRIKAGMTLAAWSAMFQQNPDEYASGRAYSHYEPAKHDDKTLRLLPGLPLQLSFDFNVNPGCHVLVGQYDPRADRFTACHEIFGPRMKTAAAMDEFQKLIAAQPHKWKEAFVFGDRSGKTENTTTTDTDYKIILNKLHQMGISGRMRVPDANPPVKERMEAFNDAMCDAKGEIHYKLNPATCPRLAKDLKFVKEDEDGLLDKTDEDLTHASDAEGYRIIRQRPIRRELQRRQGEVIIHTGQSGSFGGM